MTDPLPGLVEHDHNDGCADDNAEHWRQLYQWADKERSRIRDLWMRGLTQEREMVDGTHATAKREAWESLLGFQAWVLVNAARRPFQQLVELVRGLPDRPSAGQSWTERLHTLRYAAVELREALASDGVKEQAPVLREMYRLRRATRLAGEWLHNQADPASTGEYCHCIGCDLIRMVDVPDADSADTERSPGDEVFAAQGGGPSFAKLSGAVR